MIALNMDDVIGVLKLIAPYLAAFAIVLLAAIIAMVLCRKKEAKKKYLIRTQAGIAIAAAWVTILNLILIGPMSTLVTLATGVGKVSDESTASALQIGENIADEGIVVLKNSDNILPLSDNKKINTFGWASISPMYGGTGSGSINDLYDKVDYYEGLENAGFQSNQELIDFYKSYQEARQDTGHDADWNLPEAPAKTYSDELISNAKKYSENAVVVLARSGGEGYDLSCDMSAENYTDNSDEYDDFEAGEHYLQLSQTEEDMIDMVCSNFDNVVLVINSASSLELGWTKEYEQIKGIVLCPGPGQSGFNSLGRILSGEVNPSGKTSDTILTDWKLAPTWNNFGSFRFENMKEDYKVEDNFFKESGSPSFVNYVENIYVGYRFYETAAAEKLINYDDVVMYPFGHGLSYTTFEQKMGELTEKDGTLTFDVTVTNTGDKAGKDVVEVYYNPPYTNGGIEKSAANLLKFEKTDMLEPGDSQTFNFTVNCEEMASYDENNQQCYVLERGDYVISINKDSHTMIDSQTYNVEENIVYGESNPRSTDLVAAENLFQNARGNVTYLSRADGFANYAEATAAPSDYNMPQEMLDQFEWTANYDPKEDDNRAYPDAVMPTTGADHGIKLEQLRGLEFDDEMWETLLDEMSVEDMNTLISLSGHSTPEIGSIGKIRTIDENGPASINNTFTDAGSVGFPCPVVIACTWNVDYAYAFGESIGVMADELDTSGWYAPAMNIHRSAFSGRNFEYYSEDPKLSAQMATASVEGAWSKGVYAYIKHFAMNDQETNRGFMLVDQATEQAIREIYLNAFEDVVKVGEAKAVMASYNYIGPFWSGANSALLENVLRDEWGFDGFVLTDYLAFPYYMNADQFIRNGGDACLITYDVGSNRVSDTSAAGVQAMRSACHDLLYVVVNSRAYAPENLHTGMLMWHIVLVIADIIVVLLLAAVEWFVVRRKYIRLSGGTVIQAKDKK